MALQSDVLRFTSPQSHFGYMHTSMYNAFPNGILAHFIVAQSDTVTAL